MMVLAPTTRWKHNYFQIMTQHVRNFQCWRINSSETWCYGGVRSAVIETTRQTFLSVQTQYSSSSSTLQPLWALAAFFTSIIYTQSVGLVGRVIVARPLPTHRTTQTQNKRKQTSMPRVGFEPTIPAFERAKTVHGLDRAATVAGKTQYCNPKTVSLIVIHSVAACCL
jgi:hypothetical protein